MKELSNTYFNDGSTSAFGLAILSRGMGTTHLMKNAIFSKIGLDFAGYEFPSSICL